MRLFTRAIAFALAVTLSPAVQAGENLVVVELYTSQGCSSCPPADDLLEKLAEKDHVVALALHVDYWDYIGWKDSFANPAYTARQKSYAAASGHRSVYTPQLIIGGTDYVIGNKPMAVADAINAKLLAGSVVDLNVRRTGNSVEISADPIKGAKNAMVVQLVRYTPSESVSIKRGENAGRTIQYANIVTDWQEVGRWNGKKPLRISANASGSDPVVVIVQAAGFGPVLATARLR